MTDEKKEETVSERKKAPTKKKATKKAESKMAEENVVEKKSAPAPKRAAAPVKKAKRYSFDKWAARNGVKQHHKAGLRAFVKNVNKLRTLEEWDECFKGY